MRREEKQILFFRVGVNLSQERRQSWGCTQRSFCDTEVTEPCSESEDQQEGEPSAEAEAPPCLPFAFSPPPLASYPPNSPLRGNFPPAEEGLGPIK